MDNKHRLSDIYDFMKVYLDTCSLQRPLDTRSHIRINLEAEAVLGIIELIESGVVDLISSDVLLFETKRNPMTERRTYALEVLGKAKLVTNVDELIQRRALVLQEHGLKPLDALHLASAEAAEVDFFCTVDDRLLTRGKSLAQSDLNVVSPIELIEELMT